MRKVEVDMPTMPVIHKGKVLSGGQFFKTCPLLRQHDMRCRVVGYLTTTFEGIIIDIPKILLLMVGLRGPWVWGFTPFPTEEAH